MHHKLESSSVRVVDGCTEATLPILPLQPNLSRSVCGFLVRKPNPFSRPGGRQAIARTNAPREQQFCNMATRNAQPIVRVNGIHKYFKRGSEKVDVLNDLTVSVPEGEFLGLMGPSGSGKTTLLNLIAGLDRPSSGEVWVGDNLISQMSESQLSAWRTRSIGFIFQFYHLLPVLSAYENVELPLLLLPLSKAQRREQVTTALELVGLKDRMWHRPGQLSGGQQQRVGIARAIVTDPQLIVADEPTGDLDAKSAGEILNLLEEVRRILNKTIIMVTHDPRAAERADRVLHLDKGRLIEDIVKATAGSA